MIPKKKKEEPILLFLFVLLSLAFCRAKISIDNVTVPFAGSFINFVDDSGVLLRSRGEIFQLLLQLSANANGLYYLAVSHVASGVTVWTANRNMPVEDSGKFVLSSSGAKLLRSSGEAVWDASPANGIEVGLMRLRDDGNLVLLQASDNDTIVWQSFDYPTDTILSGQRLVRGSRLVANAERDSFSNGTFIAVVKDDNLVTVWGKDHSQTYWSAALDSRTAQVGQSNVRVAYAEVTQTALNLCDDDANVLWQISLQSDSALQRLQIDYSGQLSIMSYVSNKWMGIFYAIDEPCKLPNACGHYGLCSDRSGSVPHCSCEWLKLVNESDQTHGCAVPYQPNCSDINVHTSFRLLADGVNYFNFPYSAGNTTTRELCETQCKNNCSCVVYFYQNSSRTCYLYTDIGTLTSDGTYTAFAKTLLEGSDSVGASKSTKSNPQEFELVLGLSVALTVPAALVIVLLFWCRCRGVWKLAGSTDISDEAALYSIGERLPLRFKYTELHMATGGFTHEIGRGGYGIVYEGTLKDGSKVAVKKLDSTSEQAGRKNFYAEIATIGSVHHMNLVMLRGFCVEGPHRLLVYEFMNRGSLDRCLFGDAAPLLSWTERYTIALGTARGLDYLHSGCRDKIIHCDIKPENILLNDRCETKVSDFGLARLLSSEQAEAFTTLRGTRGYLAPEWLANMPISEKADVYSYGMVLLEILSGRKNYVTPGPSESSSQASTSEAAAHAAHYFPAYALQLSEEGRATELVDPRLQGQFEPAQVIRMVKIALCCVHEDPLLRPSMRSVVLMLEGTVDAEEPQVKSLEFLKMYARRFDSPLPVSAFLLPATSSVSLSLSYSSSDVRRFPVIGKMSAASVYSPLGGTQYPDVSATSSAQLSGPR